MKLTEAADNVVERLPSLEDLPLYIAAIRAGMRTSTDPLEEGNDEATERNEEADILFMDGPGFIRWTKEQAKDENGEHVTWMFNENDEFVGMYKYAVPKKRGLLPTSLEEGHAGWVIAPAHKGKGYGRGAVRSAFVSLAIEGITNVILNGSTNEGCDFIEHIFPDAQYLRINDVNVYAVTNPYTHVETVHD